MSARTRTILLAALFVVSAWSLPHTAEAQESGRLLATSGVVEIDGAGGGGLVPWAMITGYGTRDEIGATVHDTAIYLPDFTINSTGIGVGLYDRLELSYEHQWLYTGAAGGRLGLGDGYQFQLETVGAKLRLFGDIVYDQDTWLPEVSVGGMFKAADQHSVLRAVGADAPDGADAYIAATKLFLAQSLLVDATLRETRANEFGFLGFGGPGEDGYHPEFEGSVALLLSRHVAVGAEMRTKPDNLSFAREGNAYDAFFAWFLTKNVSATLAFVSLGPVARQGVQNGAYLSLAAGF